MQRRGYSCIIRGFILGRGVLGGGYRVGGIL